MSLTVGTGPFAKEPAGTFNFDVQTPTGAVLFWDPVPQRIRAIFGKETVVDSTSAKLLHETKLLQETQDFGPTVDAIGGRRTHRDAQFGVLGSDGSPVALPAEDVGASDKPGERFVTAMDVAGWENHGHITFGKLAVG